MKKKILISTGGSGGHVIPAISFYDHFKENFDVLMTSDKRGSNFINDNKYEYKIIEAPRIKLTLLNLPLALIKIIISTFKSILFLREKNIDILLGTGGYMSVPICLAAKALNIKIYLFEPNMVIGRANKFLLKFCKKIFCYSEKIKNFPKKYNNKIYVIDHLLRKEIYNISNNKNVDMDNIFKLLIVGGSQGAQFFNDNLKSSIINLSKNCTLKVYHQTSSLDQSGLEKFYNNNKIKHELFNFNEKLYNFINGSNLAITRAGASTLAELAFFKVPFITIPYKHATDNHQLENAINYEKSGCCWLLKEEEFNQNKLTTLLLNIINERENYLEKKKCLEKFSYKNNWNSINEKLIKSLNEN